MTAHAADPHVPGHAHAHGPHGHDEVPISERGPAPVRIIVAYGFWIFLLSDFVLFAGFFAAHGVLVTATAGGPSARDLYDLRLVEWETAALLLSSFAAGMASVAMLARNQLWFQVGMAVAGLLGALFLAGETYEFAHLVAEGNGPSRSAFLSSFFALVGCHGLHVGLGLTWLTTMMAQVWSKGFTEHVIRRVACFMLFWHALDIVWVGLFTTVYLLGPGL